MSLKIKLNYTFFNKYKMSVKDIIKKAILEEDIVQIDVLLKDQITPIPVNLFKQLLIIAINYNKISVVEYLLNAYPVLLQYYFPLHYAILMDNINLQIIETLIKTNVDQLDQTNSEGFIPLQVSIMKLYQYKTDKNREILKFIIYCYSRVNKFDKFIIPLFDDLSCFAYICAMNEVEIANYIIDLVPEFYVNERVPVDIGKTMLDICVDKNPQILEHLFKSNKVNQTSLMDIIPSPLTETFKIRELFVNFNILLPYYTSEMIIEPDIFDINILIQKNALRCLEIFIMHFGIDILSKIIKNSTITVELTPEFRNFFDTFENMLWYNSKDLAKLQILLQNPDNMLIYHFSPLNRNVLHYACINCEPKIISFLTKNIKNEILIEYLNKADDYGYTPIYYFLKCKNAGYNIELLLKMIEKVNIDNIYLDQESVDRLEDFIITKNVLQHKLTEDALIRQITGFLFKKNSK